MIRDRPGLYGEVRLENLVEIFAFCAEPRYDFVYLLCHSGAQILSRSSAFWSQKAGTVPWEFVTFHLQNLIVLFDYQCTSTEQDNLGDDGAEKRRGAEEEKNAVDLLTRHGVMMHLFLCVLLERTQLAFAKQNHPLLSKTKVLISTSTSTCDADSSDNSAKCGRHTFLTLSPSVNANISPAA